ncbi:MAG: rod-binding protein [Lachnospiraceae bacterium]|nr:rod-binding protein [Lachnospiraceae bacterium]
MDINSTTNLSDYYSNLAANADASALSSKLKAADGKNATDDELMDVCKQFESYLLEQVYKNMEKTVSFDDEEKDNQLVDYFKGLTIQEIASQATNQQSLGLAQMLYDQMKVNMGVTAEELSENAAESGTVTSGEE